MNPLTNVLIDVHFDKPISIFVAPYEGINIF